MELSLEVFASHQELVLAIILGLVVGKPFGIMAAAAIAVASGIALKPAAYTWRQLFGASVIAGIGFTMSLFIASQAFPDPGDFTAAKIAHLNLLPQGQAERWARTERMVEVMEHYFGSCTNHAECEAACPKSISIDFIAMMNADYAKAKVKNRRLTAQR